MERFNPSVGILLVWTNVPSSRRPKSGWFQSLGRDSVGLDVIGFEPPTTFLLVSIPRSGFCWFGPEAGQQGNRSLRQCFNPSVGILLVWTWASYCRRPIVYLFQSLGRDSVGLDPAASRRRASNRRVSIPRSGFCWFGHHTIVNIKVLLGEFQSLGRDSVGLDKSLLV